MDFLTYLWNSVKNGVKSVLGLDNDDVKPSKSTPKNSVFGVQKKMTYKNEISITGSKTDEQLQTEAVRSRYIATAKNPNHKIKSGENISTIAKKYGVEECSILDANYMTKESAKKIRAGQTVKIPPKRRAKNVRNLSDTAKALGVSTDFIKKLKRAEDHGKLGDSRFHNTPYVDKAGVKTIGVGHVLRKGEPQRLSNAQVCELLANDLLKVEEYVNSLINRSIPRQILNLPIEEAKKTGALAEFGEKYGDVVRVVKFGDESIEFCGGCHVFNTSEIGSFVITSEESISSGVRRIEALSGLKAYEYLKKKEIILNNARKLLKVSTKNYV